MAAGKETFYFSHDYNARNDPKMIAMLQKMGHAGKGIYWDLIEMLYEQGGYLLLAECDSYAFALHADKDSIRSVVSDFDLFKNDGVKFWSESVLRRLDQRAQRTEKAKKSAEKRWTDERLKRTQCEGNATAMQGQCDGNAIKESKGKESKGKDNNTPLPPNGGHDTENGGSDEKGREVDEEGAEGKPKRERTAFVPPTQDEVLQYFKERKEKEWPPDYLAWQSEKWVHHYTANGWKVGGNKMKDWRAAVRTWILNDYDKGTAPPSALQTPTKPKIFV